MPLECLHPGEWNSSSSEYDVDPSTLYLEQPVTCQSMEEQYGFHLSSSRTLASEALYSGASAFEKDLLLSQVLQQLPIVLVYSETPQQMAVDLVKPSLELDLEPDKMLLEALELPSLLAWRVHQPVPRSSLGEDQCLAHLDQHLADFVKRYFAATPSYFAGDTEIAALEVPKSLSAPEV